MTQFKTQSFALRLETHDSDLGTASITKIRYIKPKSRTRGEWDASVDGTRLVYLVTNDDIDEFGTWEFQGYWVIDGGNNFGKRKRLYLENPIVV